MPKREARHFSSTYSRGETAGTGRRLRCTHVDDRVVSSVATIHGRKRILRLRIYRSLDPLQRRQIAADQCVDECVSGAHLLEGAHAEVAVVAPNAILEYVHRQTFAQLQPVERVAYAECGCILVRHKQTPASVKECCQF